MNKEQERIADIIMHYHQQHSVIDWEYHDSEAIWSVDVREADFVVERLIHDGLLNRIPKNKTITTQKADGYTTYENFRKQQKEEKLKSTQTTVTNIAGRDMVGSGNVQSDLREASPVLYPNQNMNKQDKITNQTDGLVMKFWKLISDNKLISTILATLILAAIYYFFFGIKPGK